MLAAQLINHYLSKKESKHYLEIGLYKGMTFSRVSAALKDSVDPDSTMNAKYQMDSDSFFDNVAPTLEYKYDLIFIDGLHHTEQVDKDIKNSLNYLNEDGIIVLHDCNPISEMRQRVPADFDIWKYGWNGDVWKSIFKFRKNYSHKLYKTFVIETDEGLGVIKPNEIGVSLNLEYPTEFTYDFFNSNRKEILNLISLQEFQKNSHLY